MLNRLFAIVLLVLLSPIFISVALFILFEDGFPVFFKQKRVGENYTFFNIYKFRSMNDMLDGNGNLLPDSERITKMG
jgi:lipopolysaccharide/colanic/teichoic acid biosynthesis glycosyltransferase